MRLIFIFPVLLITLSLHGASHEKSFHEFPAFPAGATALTLACFRGDLKHMKGLLDQGAQVTKLDLAHARATKNQAAISLVEKAFAKQQAHRASFAHMLEEWSTPPSSKQ